MLPPFQLEQAITRTVREEWGRILAALVASTGDLQTAEDVLQDAAEIALIVWKEQGLPRSPAAWLIRTARRRAIDRYRRDARFSRLLPDLAHEASLQDSLDENEASDDIPDKRLELIFTCCHPALDSKTRIALTLRTLGGLTTDEVARAFLDKPQTMAQRLVRARKKIALAGIPYQVPASEHLPERVSAVLAVIYFIYNEGYSATSGEAAIRENLSNESIRLARITRQLLPDETEVAGLLALLLLHDSRRPARSNRAGEIVALQDQNRVNWDRARIDEGTRLLQQTLRKQRVGPYQLQAAISALHAESDDWESTDWPQIAALYDLLHALQPSPVVRLNQAIALSYAQSTDTALAALDAIDEDGALKHYQPYHAARADVLVRAGKAEEACVFFDRAIALSGNDAERQFVMRRRDEAQKLSTSTASIDP